MPTFLVSYSKHMTSARKSLVVLGFELGAFVHAKHTATELHSQPLIDLAPLYDMGQ